jgi:hypothetical protein
VPKPQYCKGNSKLRKERNLAMKMKDVHFKRIADERRERNLEARDLLHCL